MGYRVLQYVRRSGEIGYELVANCDHTADVDRRRRRDATRLLRRDSRRRRRCVFNSRTNITHLWNETKEVTESLIGFHGDCC